MCMWKRERALLSLDSNSFLYFLFVHHSNGAFVFRFIVLSYLFTVFQITWEFFVQLSNENIKFIFLLFSKFLMSNKKKETERVKKITHCSCQVNETGSDIYKFLSVSWHGSVHAQQHNFYYFNFATKFEFLFIKI